MAHLIYSRPSIKKKLKNIAQAGVLKRGEGVGIRLLECVLNHYPVGTKFCLLTRDFNQSAQKLYLKFGFQPMSLAQVISLGYGEQYCGFTYQTS